MRVLVVPKVTSPALNAQFNTPATIRSVYGLPATGGSNAIAIVDAYHYPTSLQDFNGFSQVFGLPQESSKTATASSNQHFQVVYATGTQPQSGGSFIGSWNLEEALDIEWAHAMAPNAKIYLVEAASTSMSDLDNAVRVAANLAGVKEVTMSWGGSETPYEASMFDSIFVHTGVVFFASSGDSADEMEYPAASPNVVACGGTTINRTSNGTYVSQTAWNEAGAGPQRLREPSLLPERRVGRGRRQARRGRSRLRGQSQLGRLCLRQHAVRGQLGLVDSRRNERGLALPRRCGQQCRRHERLRRQLSRRRGADLRRQHHVLHRHHVGHGWPIRIQGRLRLPDRHGCSQRFGW